MENKNDHSFVEILNFEPLNLDLIDEKRRILATLINDKQRKNRSQIFTKKYISGLLKLLKVSTESLNFIDDEILVTEFIAFMEVMSAKCFEQGDALKAEEGHIGILIEGTIFKNDPFDSKHGTYADMMVNMNIKKKMISLRTRRNSTRRTTKNKF